MTNIQNKYFYFFILFQIQSKSIDPTRAVPKEPQKPPPQSIPNQDNTLPPMKPPTKPMRQFHKHPSLLFDTKILLTNPQEVQQLMIQLNSYFLIFK